MRDRRMTATAIGKWRRYSEYRPSSVEWLGEVPQHWKTRRLKYVSSVNDDVLGENTDPDFEMLYVDISSVDSVSGIQNKELMRFENAPSRARRQVRKGDVIISTVRTYLRAIAPIDEPEPNLTVSTGFAVIRPKNGLNNPFAAYALRAPYFVDSVVARSVGVSYPAINASDLIDLRIALPPLLEQRAIAAFLDREIARIDALISKKERQIELLQEKRTALISSAVTKGLNLDVKRKSSGIEWLGEVPEHWMVGNIRRFAKMKTGHTPSRNSPEYWENCTIPWFTLADVWQLRDGRRKYLEETKERISELGLNNSAAELLPEGTVVFSRTASIGFSGIMPVAMATTQDFWNWICGPLLTPEFLLYLFRAMTQEFQALTMGSTHKTIYQPVAASISICVPPLPEQRVIAETIDHETGRIDTLIDKVIKSINLLREYRTALISAAVTGKIDVCDQKNVMLKINPAFRRAVLAAEIVSRMHGEQTFGRVKFQKMLYFCEHHLGMDLDGKFQRQAAGPFDNRMLRSVESQMKQQNWYAAQKVGQRTAYVPLKNPGEHLKYFNNYWSPYRERLGSLIDLLRPLDTERCEIVATLFAAWNDLIISRRPFNDVDIIREVRANWHESKKRFDENRLRKALQWMRDKGLVPKGYGKVTMHTTKQSNN